MGYFYTDTVIFHADKRGKGMNSTTSEKGTDNKRNNSSAYNHEYYMKNKEKWQDNDNKSGDSGSDSDSGEKEFDVDAAAMDVIRGKYGNGAERKAALGDDYAVVQKRVNELMKAQNGKNSLTSKEKNKTDGSSKASADNSKKYVRHAEVDMTNNDWRIYQGDPDYIAHHGIKGQKWGVRRFENPDGTLTAAGRKRYGDAADKIEKYSKKAARRENIAINTNSSLRREFNAALATSARSKADKKASKAEGDYKTFALNKNISRINGSSAETNANIAAGLKKRADRETGKRSEKLMDAAVKKLSTAENNEIFAKSYKSVAETKGLKKGSKAISEILNRADGTYTSAGRKSSLKDKLAEGIGNAVIARAFNVTSDKYLDKVNNSDDSLSKKVAVNTGVQAAKALTRTNMIGSGRDVVYRKQNSASKRWAKIMNDR